MKLRNITYSGTHLTDFATLEKLPQQLKGFLREQNGVIAFNGGLQIRSCSETPPWNSLKEYWTGDKALFRTYDKLTVTDIPFGQDCVGDQFFIRDNIVFRLSGETGDVESLQVDFNTFLHNASEDPDEYLLLGPLRKFEQTGQVLGPGELLSVFPLFCMTESKNGISVKNIPVEERMGFLKEVYRQIKNIPDGERIEIRFE
jgi:hypothetical protein